MEASTMVSASRTLESVVTPRPKATTQGPLTQEPNRARGQRVDTQRAEPGILSHSLIVFSCLKTITMTFLSTEYFPGLIFMRKNLENKMCSLNFTCSSMCPKKKSFPTETALDVKRKKTPEKHFPTLFITYQKTTLHINKDHQMC